VWACSRGQTHTHTQQTRVTTIHFASSTTHAKCNNTGITGRILNKRRRPDGGETTCPRRWLFRYFPVIRRYWRTRKPTGQPETSYSVTVACSLYLAWCSRYWRRKFSSLNNVFISCHFWRPCVDDDWRVQLIGRVPEAKTEISGPSLYYISGQFHDIFRSQEDQHIENAYMLNTNHFTKINISVITMLPCRAMLHTKQWTVTISQSIVQSTTKCR